MKRFSGQLPALTRLTMGTGGVTDPTSEEQRCVVRAAMEAGVWFHVADYGGGVYQVLQQAFREDPRQIPHCIFKVDGTSADGFRASLEDALRRTGVERIDIGQVCGNPVDETLEPLAEALADAKARGLVGSCIMDVIHPYSAKVMRAVETGLFDGYIFYLNVMERQLNNAAFDLLVARGTPILAIRTFGGRDGGNYLANEAHPRRQALESWYQRSGCANRVEFCTHFPLSLPNVRTTIGSTGKLAHLQSFLDAGRTFLPLKQEIVDGIIELHRQWDA